MSLPDYSNSMLSERALLFIAVLVIAACDQSPSSGPDPVTGRWYAQELVDEGREVFQSRCASCHGERAQGLAEDWRQRLPDGSYPPPPLDGSAHAWHHPRAVLLDVINKGGEQLGGNMPAFADVLTEREKRAVIAYFQDFWSEETYARWQEMGGIN